MNLPHSAGPWYIVSKKRAKPYQHGIKTTVMAQGHTNHRVCIVDGPSNSELVGEFVSNVQLIVSAPTLLSILERLTEKVDRAVLIAQSRGIVVSEDWAELKRLSTESKEEISKARGK